MSKKAITQHSMFEGLFERGLQIDDNLKQKLRAKGYDAARPETHYPVTVFEACVDVAAAELYPGLDRAQAWQLIGRRFIEGYFQTLIGKMITVSLPFLSPKTFVNRVPRFVSTGLEGAEVSISWNDERTATLRVKEASDQSGALMAGVMQVCFERMGVPSPTFVPRVLGPGDSEVRIVFAEGAKL